MKSDKVLAEIKEAVKKSMAYDELNRKFQLITNKSADEVLQRLTQTGLPSNDAQNVRGMPKITLLHELAKFYPDTPEGLGITLDAKFTDVGNVEYNHKVKIPEDIGAYIDFAKQCLDLNIITATHWVNVKSNLGESLAHKFCNWLEANGETYCNAWLDGYEVEKEPKYYIKLPDIGYLKLGNWRYFYSSEADEATSYTEKEIKQQEERYWSFAVPVEEVNHVSDR